MMQESPMISRHQVNPVEDVPPTKSFETVIKTAISIKDYFWNFACFWNRKNEIPYNEVAMEDGAFVVEQDFIQAKKYSWAVLAYEKIAQRGKFTSSPGPGNGYFDTLQLLLEEIEILARKNKLAEDIDRSPYYGLLEEIFPRMPALTRGLYPAFLYFVALRIIEEENIFRSDYWNVIMHPSEKTKFAARALIAATHNMFNALRYPLNGSFEKVYLEFEKYWSVFYEQIRAESFITPDLEISEISEMLPKCELYPQKKERARRVARYFEKDENRVIVSISQYPNKLKNTYENNRAYNHARMLIDLASKNLMTLGYDYLSEVKILEIPKG